MAEKVNAITTSKEYVAYELANRINIKESGSRKEDFRKYFLDLYAECLEATDYRRTYPK